MIPRALLIDKDGTRIDVDLTWDPASYEVMRALAGASKLAARREIAACPAAMHLATGGA